MPSLGGAFFGVHYAHRGLHDEATGAAENSPEAFRRAVAAGYGIELDIRVAACGEAMVFHDETLDRMTGRGGPVIDCDAMALNVMEISGGGGCIPRLADVLEMVDGHVPMLLEIKIGGAGGECLSRRVASVVDAYSGPAAVKSYDPHAVRAVARSAPQIPCGLVLGSFDSLSEGALPLEEFDFLSWNASDLPNSIAAGLRAGGVPVFAWTVVDEKEQARLEGHVEGVIFERYLP